MHEWQRGGRVAMKESDLPEMIRQHSVLSAFFLGAWGAMKEVVVGGEEQ